MRVLQHTHGWFFAAGEKRGCGGTAVVFQAEALDLNGVWENQVIAPGRIQRTSGTDHATHVSGGLSGLSHTVVVYSVHNDSLTDHQFHEFKCALKDDMARASADPLAYSVFVGGDFNDGVDGGEATFLAGPYAAALQKGVKTCNSQRALNRTKWETALQDL
eukprot:11263875-Karenia_brevis.AAC.1